MTLVAGTPPARHAWERRRPGAVVAGILGLVLAAVAAGGLVWLGTFPPFATVMSSSMEPAIGVGDVVVIRSFDGLPAVGDVVRFEVARDAREKANYPANVIHRVIEVDAVARTVRTQGDNMGNPDPFTIPVDAIDGRVVLTIPWAGRLLGFFVSPFGLLWLGLGLVLLVVLPFYDLHRERTELEELEVVALGELGQQLDEISEVAEDARTVLVPEVLAAPSLKVEATLQELVAAVGEYGEHLRTHTAILQAMSQASKELAAAAADLRVPPVALAARAPSPADGRPVLDRLAEAAIDGIGWATTEELAFALATPVAEVEATLTALVAAGLLDLEQRTGSRFRYRLR